jgi:CPA1 family monovalent cation:H+ antiporter
MFSDGGSVSSVLLILLGLAVAFALLARRVHVPYPVVLVLGGLGLSLLPGTPRIRLEPNLIFYGILPPLLYAAAWSTSWRDFSHHLVSIVSLAFGLVLFTIVGVALAARWSLPGFDWRIGAILGAVVAPTDAIAATAIASRLEMPRRLVDLLEGESLINDATALVAVEFATALVIANVAPRIDAGLARLAYVAGVGATVGAAVALAVDWVERRIEDAPIEMAISLMIPYGVYLTADVLHASGVVAVVTCGLMLSRRSAEFFSPTVRLQVYAVWDALVFILNGVVFVLIGLQLRAIVAGLTTITMSQLLAAGALFSVLVTFLRLAWVGPGSRLSYFMRHHLLHQTEPRPSWRELIVVGWSGMRGVVSLAAAFALPVVLSDGQPFLQRDLIVFLTFSVVVFTIVVQTLTLAPLIRFLGIEGGVGIGCEERDARRIALSTALDHLENERLHDRSEYAALYDDIAKHYRDRLRAIDTNTEQDPRAFHHRRYRALMRELLDVQRRTVLGLRNNGRINDEVLRHVERELDLESARLHAGDEGP